MATKLKMNREALFTFDLADTIDEEDILIDLEFYGRAAVRQIGASRLHQGISHRIASLPFSLAFCILCLEP